MPDTPPLNVLIAGGGVAALEAVMALRDLADDRVAITMLCPAEEFELKPLRVGVPFAKDHVRRVPLTEIADQFGISLRRDGLASVDPAARTVATTGGDEIAYDALLVAVGARPRAAFARVVTFGGDDSHAALDGILADLDGGWSKSVAFVVPPGATWPLPIYELALMTSREVRSMGFDDARLTIVTPEAAPLALFGKEASDSVSELLQAAGIAFEGSTYAQSGANGRITLRPNDRNDRVLDAQRTVALPVLDGPAVAGLPADMGGFMPIDDHAAVVGAERVWAAGDGCSFPIKQGGIATQQADAAAMAIAALAGAAVTPEPFRPVLRGKLMTGAAERYLKSEPSGGRGQSSAGDEPLWWPPGKVSGRYLTPWLAARDGESATAPPSADESVDVTRPLPVDADRASAMALDPLGTIPGF